MAGILAAGVAPAIITTPGLLMPVRRIIVPQPIAFGIDLAHDIAWTTVAAVRFYGGKTELICERDFYETWQYGVEPPGADRR